MKLLIAVLWLTTLGAAFTLGQHLADESKREPQPQAREVRDLLSEALRDRDVLSRTARLSQTLRDLEERDLESAVAVFEAQRLGVTDSEVRLLMLAWCRFDPAGALAWARAWQGPWRTTLVRSAMYAWAFRDPNGAADAFRALGKPDRDEIRASLVSGWARSDARQGLTDFLFSRPASTERSRFVGVLLAELTKEGPESIRSWAESIPADAPNKAKTTAFLTAGGALAQNYPSDAVAFFEAHQEFDYAQPALKTIARRWVDFHEPAALFDWLVSLPASAGRADAVEAGFTRWWSQSPQEASAWLRAAPTAPAFDPAVAVFARQLSRTSAERAVGWAERIHDEPLRRRTLAPILRLWSREDAPAARAWMNAQEDLPKELQREFLRAPPT